jgi:NifU-like protein involved in Fe-S cluster formation
MQYSEKVLEHFMHPHHIGVLENADVTVTQGSPSCGDQVTFYLKVDPTTGTIAEVRFQSFGCAANIASASMVSDLALGKTLAEATNITWAQTVAALDGLPEAKEHCSELAVNTLLSAIAQYRQEHGDNR